MNKLTELQLAHEKGRLEGLKESLDNFTNKFVLFPKRKTSKTIQELEAKISTAVIEPAEDDGKRKARELIDALDENSSYCGGGYLRFEDAEILTKRIFNLSEGE